MVLALLLLSGDPAVAGDAPMQPSPARGVDRLWAFDQRGDHEQVDAIARTLFDRTFIGSWDAAEFRRPGRWAELQVIRGLIDGNDLPAALERFKLYTLQKLRDADQYGLSTQRFDAYAGGPVMWRWVHPLLGQEDRDAALALAHDLMTGKLTVNGKPIAIGEPGRVDWKTAVAAAGQNYGGAWPWHVDAFAPLLAAYVLTGDRAFMDRWSAYADDWAINQAYGVSAATLAHMPDQWAGGADMTIDFLRYMNALAHTPGGADALPAATFARVMNRLVGDYLPVAEMYHRANANGWTELSAASQLDVALFLDEYRCAPDLVHDAIRKIELMAPFRHMPDGGDVDSTIGYHYQYMMGAGPVLDRLKFRALRLAEWELPAWERRDLRDHFHLDWLDQGIRGEMRTRARMLAGHIQANGEWPIGGTRDAHENRAAQALESIPWFVPEAMNNPDVAAIVSLGAGPMAGAPSFTSESLPYSGHHYMRAGWAPGDPYLYMYCSPHPAGGSLSRRNNNALGISGWGQDLIGPGDNGPYDEPHSPVRVDDREQFFWAGVPSWGHRGTLLAWHDPAPWRSHDSPDFDLAEGVYNGAYAGGCTDVTHHRVVHFVRRAGLWIVTDRLTSPTDHRFSLDWRFAIQPSKVPTDFTPDQIAIDAGRGTIRTARPSPSNISLYHFPSSPLRFSSAEEHGSATNHYLLHDFLRVSGEWAGKRESVVVTAIIPYRDTGHDLHDITAMTAPGAVGFTATAAAGLRVECLAAVAVPGNLEIGPVIASAESLVCMTSPDHTTHGMLLGATTLSVNGHPVALPSADVEFSIAGAEPTFNPIYRPLAPVEISPADSNSFIGTQSVTLASATRGALIRYTCDGSDPDLASPLYSGPFTIDRDVQVKARGFRPGVTAMPRTLNGTLLSAVTRARFVSEKLHPPVMVARATAPGLRYERFTGRWQDLLAGLDQLTPSDTGVAAMLFDPSVKPLPGVYAVRFSGWLEAPADGLYTFFAPPESYEPNITAGYELNVYVDGIRWYPATSLHAVGTWSIALQQGKHELTITFADLRGDDLLSVNRPGMRPLVWDRITPSLELSGPTFRRAPIPATMLSCTPSAIRNVE